MKKILLIKSLLLLFVLLLLLVYNSKSETIKLKVYYSDSTVIEYLKTLESDPDLNGFYSFEFIFNNSDSIVCIEVKSGYVIGYFFGSTLTKTILLQHKTTSFKEEEINDIVKGLNKIKQ
jgi:hypothetical protein